MIVMELEWTWKIILFNACVLQAEEQSPQQVKSSEQGSREVELRLELTSSNPSLCVFFIRPSAI